MRQIVIGLLIVAAAASPAAAQSFEQGTPLMATWLAADNETAAQVTRYEARLDADAFAPIGMVYTYLLPQTRLTLGSHTFRVRACNTAACGAELAVTFSIIPPVPPTPNAPRNGVIQRVPVAALAFPDAVEYAQSYARWAIGRYLTPTELGWLAARHPAVPPTRYTILDLMDAAYAEMLGR